jgi:glycerophosphoryl diester phosphodiesterase
MRIIAHRGASHDAPENTMAAFRLAWEQEADGAEFDIQMTHDGKAAVIHDDTTLRTAGRPGRVRDLTLAELQGFDAGVWKDPRWRGERVPELSEVLASFPEGKLAFIEIKCGPEIIPEVARVLRATHFPRSGTRFVGFRLETMAEAKRRFPVCEVLWNVEMEKDVTSGTWVPVPEELIRGARESGLDGLGISLCDGVDAEFVGKIRDAGLKLFVWTADDPEHANRMRDLGVEYLATNRAGWLRERMG